MKFHSYSTWEKVRGKMRKNECSTVLLGTITIIYGPISFSSSLFILAFFAIKQAGSDLPQRSKDKKPLPQIEMGLLYFQALFLFLSRIALPPIVKGGKEKLKGSREEGRRTIFEKQKFRYQKKTQNLFYRTNTCI